jgi:hypothetical protein
MFKMLFSKEVKKPSPEEIKAAIADKNNVLINNQIVKK